MKADYQYTPLELPGQFYSSEEGSGRRRKKSKTWTDGLVWDPREDAFDTAYRKVLDRAKAIAILSGEELVSTMFLSHTSQLMIAQPNRPL
jgi:hypothetical protein